VAGSCFSDHMRCRFLSPSNCQVLAIPATLAISSVALCLCPSARYPPPIALLLKTKVQPQFDSTVDRAVEAFFCVFQQSNLAQFQPCFLVSAVRSTEGRKPLCGFG
jgi:hypothetical protein